MRPVVPGTALAVLLVGATGCGGERSTSADDALAAVRGATDRARQAATVTYTVVGTTGQAGNAVALSADGALDLADDGGRMRLSLAPDGDPTIGDPYRQPLELRWSADRLWSRVPEVVPEWQVAGRDGDGAPAARMIDEPAGLLEALADAEAVQRAGAAYAVTVPTDTLARHGVPGVVTRPTSGRLVLQVRLDASGRPTEITYALDVPSLVGPTGTHPVQVTYRYRDWGRPVDVGAP